MKTVSYVIEYSLNSGKTWGTWGLLLSGDEDWKESLPGESHRMIFRFVKRTAITSDEILAEEPRKDVVIFRKTREKGIFGGEVIALFPEIESSPGLVQSFMHFGQHGGADYEAVMSRSRTATEAEYSALKKELESAPYHYRLDVRKRRPDAR